MDRMIVKVGLLGCGTVGSAVVRILKDHADDIAERSGCQIQIARVAVRDADRDREVDLDPAVITTDSAAVIDDPDVQIVCEVMGGIQPTKDLMLKALAAGKPVVTANKEVLARFGDELYRAADSSGVDLLFEASVGGGIALVRPMMESLAGDRIVRITGILNGTTNFILSRMAQDAMDFRDALAEAQMLGFAEADPTADVEGFDAASKLAILASLAFNAPLTADDVSREGISAVSADDIRYAQRLGYAVKLLAVAQREDERVSVRVHPAMIPTTHALAAVGGSLNAVFVEGERVGEQMFYGRGAGGDPTAVAVIGDLIAAARNLQHGGSSMGMRWYRNLAVVPASESRGEFYLRLDVEDTPGVLARIAAVFGDHGVSIKSVVQEGIDDDAQLVFITHDTTEGSLQGAVDEFRDLPVVHEVRSVLRVEGE